MNFYVILVIVYFYGEFGYIKFVRSTTNEEKLAKKMQKVKKEANMQFWDHAMYRYTVEEPALLKANKRNFAYKSYTQNEFIEHQKPEKGRKAKKLWKKAKKSLDKYHQIKSRFEEERFCQVPLTDTVCKRAFKNRFFKKQNLIYDDSSKNTGDRCVSVSYPLVRGEINKKYSTHYKSCLAKRITDGITFKIYLQSAYKQPVVGKWKFFVIYKFIKDPHTGQEIMPLGQIGGDEGTYRYQAYLSLDYW